MTNVTSTGAEAGDFEVNPSATSENPPKEGIEFEKADSVSAVGQQEAETGGTPPENIRFKSAPDAAVEPSPSESSEIQTPAGPSFADLGLSPDLLKAVEQSGYTIPTPIQAQGIPHVLQRRDIIGIAQTGTGKTASFTLPMIELLARGRAKARMPRSLILEPTRELAAQVAESFEKYGKYNKLSMALLIGGTSFEDQDRKLDRGVDVLIATPGRLMDHFQRGKLLLGQVQILVVDEADRMLDMGFIPDVEEICKKLPFTRQTLFYSATMPPEIQRLTEKFLHNPVRVEVARPATTATNITQEIIKVPNNDWAKREALRRLIRDNTVKNAIVFCNRKTDVDIVAKSLAKHGFNAAPLHGDLDQSVRTRTLDGFRAGTLDFLVASDVAARGLDIPAVSHVFNYDAPYHADDYVHRIGRTGRAGRSGHTYMLVTSRDEKYVEQIEKLIGRKIEARTLEGLAEATQARPPRDDRGGRDRGKSRGGRGNDRDRKHTYPVKPHGQVASMEPTLAPAPQPVAAQPAPQPVVAQPSPQPVAAARPDHRNDHRPKQHAPKPPQQQHKPQRHQQEDDNRDARSQLPAFLLRPVKLPPVVEKPASRAKKKDTAES